MAKRKHRPGSTTSVPSASNTPQRPARPRRRWPLILAGIVACALLFLVWSLWRAEYADARFDAEFVGSQACGSCHSIVHSEWTVSPHANMIRDPSPASVIGDFDDGEFRLPADSPDPLAGEVVARTYTRDGDYFMAMRHPEQDRFVEFPITKVVGYQYRQEYLTPEAGGVIRRLPLQWSTATQSYFPYWNVQENSAQTVDDLWAQMRSLNSAWNMYCARCHTTDLQILERDEWHTRGKVQWHEDGITCESCHGPGSRHVDYMNSSIANRLVMWINNHLHGRPVAYIASAAKLPKGQALSVCARCHGADIFNRNQDTYRQYQPGYSVAGKTNDLSMFFHQAPLTPGRMDPTVEVWHNGRPRGIGMLFRSFVESACYAEAEVRCHDCHNPHNNKQQTVPGILAASAASNAYCSQCHQDIVAAPAAHTKHIDGQPGSFCYDCHMPWHITKLNRGIWERARTHQMSSIPNPQDSLLHGLERAPNACSDCHEDHGPQWALEQMETLWPGASQRASAQPSAAHVVSPQADDDGT